MKKDTPGMNFEADSERPATLHEYFFQFKTKKIEQKRFQIINGTMQIKPLKTGQFPGSNDKPFLSRRNSFSSIWTFFAQ